MEGTLLQKEPRLDDGAVAPSAWTVLAEALGPSCLAEENATKQRWLSGEYSGYLEWMRKTVEIHQKFGLTKQIFDKVVQNVPFMQGVEQAIRRMHSHGAITAVVTGGFKALADRVQRQLRLHHSFAACEYFFDERDGLIEHFNLLPADEEGKVDFMRLLCREYKVESADCAFVGDGKNDVHLAKAVGCSIAFNAQPELAQVTTLSISQSSDTRNFETVVDVMERHFANRR